VLGSGADVTASSAYAEGSALYKRHCPRGPNAG
jgi:hypothetical protein